MSRRIISMITDWIMLATPGTGKDKRERDIMIESPFSKFHIMKTNNFLKVQRWKFT